MRAMTYTLRALRRSPRFVAVVVATLALGIGANTAIFSVIDALLLSPLPYRDPSQLVFVWSDMSDAGYPRAPLSGPEVQDLRERTTQFSDFGAIWATAAALTGERDGEEPEQIRIGLVTNNFFSVLGASAARGRLLSSDDASDGPPSAILLSWSLWQRRFGGDPGLVGRSIQVNGRPLTVVGVMPRDFRLLMPPDASVPDDLDAWLPFGPRALTAGRGQQYLRVVGRMKGGVTLAEGRADIDRVASAISREFAEYGANGRKLLTVGLQADGTRLVRPMLLALFGGVTILLLIACVNVAGLLVTRAVARARETAVKLSLGAARSVIVRECLVEGVTLAALGAVAGAIVAYLGLRGLLLLRPESLSRLGAARINLPVLAACALTAAICGVLVSLAPAAELSRTSLAEVLQRDGRLTGGVIRYRLRSGLVVAQVALSVVLLVAAGMMYRTFLAIQHVSPGFASDGVLSFKVNAPLASRESFNDFARQLQTGLAALPQVSGVGSVSHVPFDNVPNWGGAWAIRGDTRPEQQFFADYRSVSPGWFETVRASLVAGRLFSEDDDPRAPLVVIVDEQLARRAWPGVSPLGQQIGLDPFSNGQPNVWATVVGVVRHLRHRSAVEALNDQVFFTVRQIPRLPLAFAVRTTGDPAALGPAVRRLVAGINPKLPVYQMRPLSDYVAGARAPQRFTAVLASAFAAVALALSSIGLFGMIAYATTRRRAEFGIRLALGAAPGALRALVIREGALLAGVGVGLGAIAAGVVAHALRSQLYGIDALDPASYAAALVAIGIATVAACWLPAHRAARTSPMTAIRAE